MDDRQDQTTVPKLRKRRSKDPLINSKSLNGEVRAAVPLSCEETTPQEASVRSPRKPLTTTSLNVASVTMRRNANHMQTPPSSTQTQILPADPITSLFPLSDPKQFSLPSTASVAQLDLWPLTPPRHSAKPPAKWKLPTRPSDLSTCTSVAMLVQQPLSLPLPLSPREQRLVDHHKAIDNSKTKPLLLQELEQTIADELQKIHNDDQHVAHTLSGSSTTIHPIKTSNLRRFHVFHRVFGRLISEFSVYSGLLGQIHQEYDMVVDALVDQLQHNQLQLHQCTLAQQTSLQQVSQAKLANHLQLKALKRELKRTQRQLTLLMADHAALQDASTLLRGENDSLRRQLDDMKRSNLSLMAGMKRQEEHLRLCELKTEEDVAASTQLSKRYHHAIDEIAELRKTVGSLEEKVGGVHLAADKSTIVLLSKEIQELHGAMSRQRDDQLARKYELLTKAFVAFHSRRSLGGGVSTGAGGTSAATNGAVSGTGGGVAMKKAMHFGPNALPRLSVDELVNVLERHELDIEHKSIERVVEYLTQRLRSHTSVHGVPFTAPLNTSPTSGDGHRLMMMQKVRKAALAASNTPSLAMAAMQAQAQVQGQGQTQTITQSPAQGNADSGKLQPLGGDLSASSATFVTNPTGTDIGSSALLLKPEERDETQKQEQLVSRLMAKDAYLTTQGMSLDVPEYLRLDGLVRNLFYSKKKVDALLRKVWLQKDEAERVHQRRNNDTKSLATEAFEFGSGVGSTTTAGTIGSASSTALNTASSSSSSNSTTTTTTNNKTSPTLAQVMTQFLFRVCSSRSEAIESAYNLVHFLERNQHFQSDYRLFLLVLKGELPEEARQEQLRVLTTVNDALANIDKEVHGNGSMANQLSLGVGAGRRNSSNGIGGGGALSTTPSMLSLSSSLLPNHDHFVPLSDVFAALKVLFPWKSASQLSQLYRALLVDQKGSPFVDYAALLLSEDKNASKRSAFNECIRAQHLEDLLNFRQLLQKAIRQKLAQGNNATGVPAATTTATATSGANAILTNTSGNGATPVPAPTPSAVAEASGTSNTQENLGAAGTTDAEYERKTPTESDETGAGANSSNGGGSGSGATCSSSSTFSFERMMISIRNLRQCIQQCDPAKPVEEINRLLSLLCEINMEKVLHQDEIVVNGQDFLSRLKTVIIRPTGKWSE